ncbi:ankyrin repeat domain-containing protein [Rickettsia bellii]|uniref:Ankyrin repeats family protein n=1 Tax=Rickettsia bellii str. RML Mogi TaxID=1359194 RepID=A0A0F3QG14_RICBE|nr:ankyrin repeat domain-containing protein [Rickettsia bellii]KJV91530.1 ankyrin repeats family protein [Rickettsia bellii str. RML Mogi]
MFSWLFSWFQTPKTSHEKLIEAIEARNEAEAQNLIVHMDTAELSKVNNDDWTALTFAAAYGLEKVCEVLIPKMSYEAINCWSTNSFWFGFTAFTWVTLNGDKKICELLIPKTSPEVIIDILKLTKEKQFIIEAINSCNKTSPEVIINILKLAKEKQFMIEAINNYNNKLVKELNLILDENNPNNAIKMIRAVKIYKKLFKEYLTVEKTENFKPLQNTIEDFIKNNFFTAAGVCKNLIPKIDNNEIHISCLTTEIIAHIVEYLENEKWGLEVETLG